MQAYSEMKDSGIEWLGKLPGDWSVSRVGSLFKHRNEKVSDKDFEPLSVTKKGIVPQLDDAAKTNDGDNRKKVLKGDFVINSRSDRKGSSGVSPIDGSVSLINTVLSQGKLDSRYTHHLLRSQPFQEEFYRYGQGIVADLWSTNYSRMKGIALPVPPKLMQEKIADFLDTETAQIDNLIAKQERLLELLEEKRRATITHAVTRGLNPSVELKETNIPWLAQIPVHWTVEKFSNLYLNTNAGEVIPKEYWDPNGVELLYTASQNPIHSNFATFPQQKRTSRGDILIARNGDGVIHDPQPDSIYTNVVQRIRLDTLRLDKGYIIYALKASLGYVHGQSNGDFIVSLNMGMWNKTRLALPKLSEQRVIREHLDSELEKNERLKQKIQTQITLLRERRTSLISHAVTGKVRI